MDLCVELHVVRRADTTVCREVCANKRTICSRRTVFKHVGYLFDGSVRRRLPFDLFLSVRGGWGHPLLDNNNLLYRHHRRDCTVKQRAIHTHTRSHARTRTNVDHYTTDLQHKHSTVRATSGRHHPKLYRKQG